MKTRGPSDRLTCVAGMRAVSKIQVFIPLVVRIWRDAKVYAIGSSTRILDLRAHYDS